MTEPRTLASITVICDDPGDAAEVSARMGALHRDFVVDGVGAHINITTTVVADGPPTTPMTVAEYARWWDQNTTRDGDVDKLLDEPTRTLARHVLALQGRLDNLPDPDQAVVATYHPWVRRCACAHGHPDDVCMTHRPTVTVEENRPAAQDNGANP